MLILISFTKVTIFWQGNAGRRAISSEIQTAKGAELLKTLFTGKNCIELEAATSTNAVASERIMNYRPPEGTAIRARFQTAGKGQASSAWESEPGENILVSYIFYPKFLEPKDLFNLNKAVTLGVYDYLKSILKVNTCIKWPNDIIYTDKKIAGILIENSVTFSEVNHSVSGIGINVNQKTFKGYVPEAISLFNATGKKYDLEECFAGLSSCLEFRYLQLKREDLSAIHSDYRNALYRLGEQSLFMKKRMIFKARIIGVTDDGKLILEDEKGKMETYRFKEVGFASEAWEEAKKAREKKQTV